MPSWRVTITLLLVTMQCIGCAGAGKPPTPPALPAAPSSATAGATTIVAIAPPPAPAGPSCTLAGFLGLDKLGAGIGGLFQRAFSRIKNALGLTGKFPGLQAQPPVLPITDPANLGPNAPPAVKAAAAAKMEEDQAGQKIQALRYLATLGCGGCYPAVEDAMLAGLDDCTEAVRYEAALALRGKDGQTRCCNYCKCGDCCSDKIRKKLDEIANKMDDKNCYKEPSERVRRVAREALAACGGFSSSQSPTPTEGPTEAPLPDPAVSGPAAGVVPEAPAPAAIVPGSSAGAAVPNPFSGVQLASFEQPTAEPQTAGNPVLATVDGEPIHESKVFRSLDVELQRAKAQGTTVGPERFQALLIEQIQRSVDCRLLLREAHREQARSTGYMSARPLDAAEIDAWLAQALKVDSRISLLELNARYQAEAARYRTAPQVKWEQVSVPVARLKSRDEARLLITYLHNRAQGVRCEAPDVNLHAVDTRIIDWTPRDRIGSKLLAQTLSRLPAGATSPILEENGAFQIVRVLEHRAGGVVPFEQAVDAMRKEILAERRTQAERQLLEKLRAEAKIWTAFDPAVKTADYSVDTASFSPSPFGAEAAGVVPVGHSSTAPRFQPGAPRAASPSEIPPGTYMRPPFPAP
ncbi:MAG: hypothetical protein K8U03_09815 [Planctomycetia bacterium]|nr:hypothetical protein [Planctomycetia bacterium]